MMDGRRPAGIMSGDPAAVQALAPVYRWLQESPDTAYRASLLPMRRTVTGEVQPAIPGALMGLMRGAADLVAGPQTGIMTPEATEALASLAGSSVTQAPQAGVLAAMRGPDRFAKLLSEEWGIPFRRSKSSLSGSQYFEVETPNGRNLKIRFSDHDLPPTYKVNNGEADYEVGTHGDAAGTAVSDAAKWLSEKLGLDLPPSMKAAVTRRDNVTKAAAEKEAAIRAEMTAQAEAHQGETAKVLQALTADPVTADEIVRAMSIAKNDKRNAAVDRIAQRLGTTRQAVKDAGYKAKDAGRR